MAIPLVLLVNANKNNLWITTNIDDGKLEYYFILLAMLMVIDNLYLIYISKGYKYNDFPDTARSGENTLVQEIESPIIAVKHDNIQDES